MLEIISIHDIKIKQESWEFQYYTVALLFNGHTTKLEMGRHQNFNRYQYLNFQIIFNSLMCQEPLFHMYTVGWVKYRFFFGNLKTANVLCMQNSDKKIVSKL